MSKFNVGQMIFRIKKQNYWKVVLSLDESSEDKTNFEVKLINITLCSEQRPSKINFLKFELSVRALKHRIVEHSHNLICRHFKIGDLFRFVNHLDVGGRVLNRVGLRVSSGFRLKPRKELLIGFIGLKGIKDVSFLTQKAIDLIFGF